ncbi:MAG: hypothetical protein L0241_15065 [Planctomycetia bacterium]|nr:hypothetical protein [Planctomycetia bacterium]
MSARLLSFAALFSLLVFAGCGAKTEPTPVEQVGQKPVPPVVIPKPPDPPVEEKPNDVQPPPSDVVPVTEADIKRLEDLTTEDVRSHGPQDNGGYLLEIRGDANAEQVLASLKGVKCIVGLTLEGKKITDDAFKHLAGFDYLESLMVVKCPNVKGPGLVVLPQLPRLKALTVVETAIMDSPCQPISQCKKLEEVRLLRTRVTDKGLGELSTLPALHFLGLDGSIMAGAAFKNPGWVKLRVVEASGTRFDNSGMDAVANLPVLERLNVSSTRITDVGARHLIRTQKLTHLECANTEVGDGAMPTFGRLKTLAHLNLQKTSLTDAGLGTLEFLDSLQELDLESTAVTGSGFAKFPAWPKLRKLNLSSTSFDDSGGAHLGKFAGLTNLALRDCSVTDRGLTSLKQLNKLTQLDLTKCKVGDETAKLLGSHPELISVWFLETELTDAGAKALAPAPKLRFMHVRGSKVTKQGAGEAAKFGRPALRIEVEE